VFDNQNFANIEGVFGGIRLLFSFAPAAHFCRKISARRRQRWRTQLWQVGSSAV
jgi:hypothetical protein